MNAGGGKDSSKKTHRRSNQRPTAGDESPNCSLNPSGIRLSDEISVESGLPARFDPGWLANASRGRSALPRKEAFAPLFHPITTPAETNFWLNDRSMCFLPESLVPSKARRQEPDRHR
jgi:hypothetical protein